MALGSWQINNPAPFSLIWGHSEARALHRSPELAHAVKLQVELTSMVVDLSADPFLAAFPSLYRFPTSHPVLAPSSL